MAPAVPSKQRFSWVALAGDLLSQTKNVVEQLAWYPELVARHIKADGKYRGAQTRMHERAALEIEALTKEPSK